MELPLAAALELQVQALVSSNDEETYVADPATVDGDIDDMIMQKSEEVSGESPGARTLLRELDLLNKKHLTQDTPTKSSVKVLERPKTSGDQAATPLRYQMAAANFRQARLKHPNALKPQVNAVQTALSTSPEVHESSRSGMSNAKPETKFTGDILPSSPAEPSAAGSSPQDLPRPATRGKCTAAATGQEKGFWHAHKRDENTQLDFRLSSVGARPAIQDLTDIERSKIISFNFAPTKSLSDNLCAVTPRPVSPPKPSARTEQVSIAGPSGKINSMQAEKVLPSIEVDSIGPDVTLVERPSQRVIHHEAITPEPKPYAQIQPPAPRADRQTSVLEGRIVKRLLPNTRARKPATRGQSRLAAGDASQPTEEDLLFLMMARNRLTKDREFALEASHKQLCVQIHRLHEQSRTFHQQLAAADARTERQNSEITAYKSQIENFKSRFTKFKIYAKDLAQDYADMGTVMKQIGNTTNELVRDKADISRILDSLRKSSASASGILVGLGPKISAAAQETGSLQQALHLAEQKVRMTGTCLQHERLRNNRIETQILDSKQLQERLSLSSMQEYRKAAVYLDDLCQAIIQLGKTVIKKQQPKDTPGVVQCLNLLQMLAEKQGTGITTLIETKTLVGVISERLLSYHTSAEEATKIATSHGEQLSKDVFAQIATSLGGLGPSMGTEVDFVTLRERVATLQKEITLGSQMINLAYEGKNASEQREKEQSRRVDELLEQLAETNKRQESTIATTSPPNPGPDLNMILTKYMQASANFNSEQSKVNKKDEELYHKSIEILALNEKLKSLQAESEALRSSLAGFQGQHESLQEQADAAVQENIALKGQLENLESASLQAARVPKLVENLAAKDAELAELRPQAVKVHELVQAVAGRDTELNKLRLEAAKIPALVEDLTGRDTELGRLRLEAAKVPELGQELVDRETELVKLRERAFATSELREKVTSSEVELIELRPKAAQLIGTASQNMVYQSQIHGHKNTIQTLEQQLAGLGAQLGPMKQSALEVVDLQKENTALKTEATTVKQTIQDLENELRKSQGSAQQVENLKKEITTLRIHWADHDQLKKDLTTQKDLHAKQVARLSELQSKLEESQKLSNQVPDLQLQVEELSQKCGTLNQQLSEATQAAEGCQTLQNGLEQKDEEIVSLKFKLQNFEETSRQLIAAQEESQQNTRQLIALQEQIAKLQIESQKLPALKKPDIHPVDEADYPTQQTMLDLRDLMDREEQAHASEDPAATLQNNFLPIRQDTPQREKADRSSTRARNNVSRSSLQLSYAHETEISNSQEGSQKPTKDVDNSQQIPDSQPQINMQTLLATSSPLSEVDTTDYFSRLAGDTQRRRRDNPHSRSPSSSYGGDSMLLEDFEAMEGMIEDSRPDSLGQNADISLSQWHSHKRAGYGHASSRTIVTNSGTGSGSRRLRRGLSSQVIEETQSQEQRPSSPNIVPSSPAGPMKHLPNSAIKRPRLDPVEATPSTQTSRKRLKRTPANLDVSRASKRPNSSSTQITEPEPARPTRASLPSGSRKGSVIGANAPAPGKTRGSRKTSRKGSKSDRYTERFSHE